jgi:hypothetical protein
MQKDNGLFLGFILVLILLSACITQQESTPNPTDNPADQTSQPQQPANETPPATEPNITIPGQIVSGEFNLKVSESIKNLRGAGIYANTFLELRVKSIIYRFFPMSKIAVFEVLDNSGNVITQRDVRIGRYLNEDIVTEDTYEPVLLDTIYAKDVVVSEEGNSVTIEVNK